MGLAVNARDPRRVIAAGAGIALSTNGGRSWRTVLNLPQGAGPIAWSTSRPTLAYAVGSLPLVAPPARSTGLWRR